MGLKVIRSFGTGWEAGMAKSILEGKESRRWWKVRGLETSASWGRD